MRLTLRTLLAYLDDTLPPDQAREIGHKVAESQVAQELIDRIKKVTRRRGLTVPPAAGPDRIDANTVAEYLDNDLPSEKVAEVEELALNSDVHLAEIAACHQILTLVMGEPAHVPPPARQRMYTIVKGKEADHTRRAARVGPAGLPGEVETPEQRRAERRGMGYRLLGAAVLAAALGVAIWQALANRARPAATPATDEVADAGPAAVPTPDVKSPDANPNPTPKPPDTPPPSPDASKVAPPPAAAPPKQPIDQPPDRTPNPERREIGVFATKDAVLLQPEGDSTTWVRVPPDGRVRTAAPLLSLPGYHSEVRLDSGARLTLFGNLPDLIARPVLSSQVTLHAPPAGFDADITLDRGRVYLAAAKKAGPTKARVRFAGEIWDVTLADEKAEVMVELVSSLAGQPFRKDGQAESPLTQVTFGVVQGAASVKADFKAFNDLQAPPGLAALTWDSKGGGVSKAPQEYKTVPPAWGKTPAKAPTADRQRDIDAALAKLAKRVGEKNKEVGLAVDEIAEDPARWSKVLALYCQGALGMLTRLTDALDDARPEVRQAAAAALEAYAARKAGNDVQIYEDLVSRKGYGDRQAAQVVQLLHGFTDAELNEPVTYSTLISALGSDQLAVRALAVWRLGQADPDGAERIRFNSSDTDMNRERAIAEWKRRVPEGKLPPSRTAPEGRLPGRERITG